MSDPNNGQAVPGDGSTPPPAPPYAPPAQQGDQPTQPMPPGYAPPAYGAQLPAYGAQQPQYGSQQAYGAQQPQYQATPPAYGVTPTPYGQPYGMAPYAPPQRTNVMAILSLVFAFVFSILGIVFGHIALGQIKRTGEAGHGLAMAGLILGYVFTGIIVLYFIFIFGIAFSSIGRYSSY